METADKEKEESTGERCNPEMGADASVTEAGKGKKRRFVDMTLLIRSLQRLEGNPDCFRRAKNHCDRLDCAWRVYCLGERGQSV